MHKFPVGAIVDLYDQSLKQWRGEYIVIKTPEDERLLYKIRNTRTNSQQFVREASLRAGRLKPYRVESLR